MNLPINRPMNLLINLPINQSNDQSTNPKSQSINQPNGTNRPVTHTRSRISKNRRAHSDTTLWSSQRCLNSCDGGAQGRGSTGCQWIRQHLHLRSLVPSFGLHAFDDMAHIFLSVTTRVGARNIHALSLKVVSRSIPPLHYRSAHSPQTVSCRGDTTTFSPAHRWHVGRIRSFS